MDCAVAAALSLDESTWEGGAALSSAASAPGRDRALVEAVREHEAVLRGIALRLCGNQADADDLVQETYERALRAFANYADRGNLRSWLATILNNLFIDRCRKAKRTPRSEAIDDEVAAPEVQAPPAWAQVTPVQITEALAQIGDEFRRVYELHSAGKSYDEISAEMSIPKNTVGTRLVRARKKLKEILSRRLEER
jgi:RNA polymerase sigma-70 factor, ECF subfamily